MMTESRTPPAEVVDAMFGIAEETGQDPFEFARRNIIFGMQQAEAEGDNDGYDYMSQLYDALAERAHAAGQELFL
jgi:hypothetical protein